MILFLGSGLVGVMEWLNGSMRLCGSESWRWVVFSCSFEGLLQALSCDFLDLVYVLELIRVSDHIS